MKTLKLVILLGFLFVLSVSYTNCGPAFESSFIQKAEEDLGSGGAVSVSNKVESRVEQIFTKNCASCHNSEIKFAGIENITDLAALKMSGMANAVVASINSGRMPPAGHLSISDKHIINNWLKGLTSFEVNDSHSCVQVAAKVRKGNSNELWLLSKSEFNNVISETLKITVADIQKLPDPFVNHGFQKNRESAVVDDFVFSEHSRLAEVIANQFTANINNVKKVLVCDNISENSLSKACVDKFIKQTVGRLHRKSLSSSDIDKYYKIYQLSSDFDKPVLKGLGKVVYSALLSPHFLYKKSIHSGLSNLDHNYVIAEDLAFHIYRSIPDDQLMIAAERGELTDNNARKGHIIRMLNTDKGQEFFKKYIADYFQMYYLESYKPNTSLSQEVKDDYMLEFNKFVEQVMSGDSRLSSLLSSSQTSPSRSVASLAYGLNGNNDGDLISHNPSERAGLLTLPGFILTTSTLVRNAPGSITRGVFVREKLLCHEMGTPPAVDEQLELEDTPENKVLNARERFEKSHLVKKDCKSCHSLIDPIGFGLSYFNDFGKLELMDPVTNGPVDKSGFVQYTENSNFSFSDATDLSRKLASSVDVSNCFAKKTFEYLQGQEFASHNLCSVQKFQKEFKDSGGNIFALVVSILNEPLRYSLD